MNADRPIPAPRRCCRGHGHCSHARHQKPASTGRSHAFEVLAPLLGVVLLLNRHVRKIVSGIIGGCLLMIAGIFVHRILLMPAAFNQIPLTLVPGRFRGKNPV